MTTETEASQTPIKKIHIPRWVIVVLFCLTLGIGVVGGAAATVRYAYRDRIFRGISVGNVDVSGMTVVEATEAVQQAMNTLLDAGISVSFGNDFQRIELSPRGASDPDLVYELAALDIPNVVASAYTLGRAQETLTDFFTPLWLLTFGATSLPAPVTFSESRIADALRTAYPNAESPGTPTDFAFTSAVAGGNFDVTIVDAVAGSTLDVDRFFIDLAEDVQDLHLDAHILTLVERSTLVTSSEAETLIPYAQGAVMSAPYTLTFTDSDDASIAFSYTISQEELFDWIEPQKTPEGELVVGISHSALAPLLATMHADIDVAPQDAKFSVADEKVVEFVPSRDGLVVDDDALFADLSTLFMQEDDHTSSLALTVTRKEPEIPIERINTYGITEVLGVGYSSFAGSPSNRRKNIRHGAEKLNGILIPPGETLSLLEKLRPFTVEDGYFPELVIKGDEIIPEVGGGLCQIGTTTFRAAMNSGLEIAERRNHSLVVSYYNDPSNGNPGTDATIYDPAPDLKITNTTAHYIMLTTDVDDTTSELHFTFWGTSDGRQGSYTPPQVLSWTGYGTKTTKETTSLEPGVVKCQTPHPGATTTFDYIIAWADGTTTTRTFDSSYRALPEICLVGVAAPSIETPTTETPTSDIPLSE